MTITRDDLYRKTTGELTRLFSAAKADARRHSLSSEEFRLAWDILTMIRTELNRRQP